MSTNDHDDQGFQPWEFKAHVPDGDNPDITHHLAEGAVNKIAAALRDVVISVEVHEDLAPQSAVYVMQLCSAVAHELLVWIRKWPK